MPRKLNKIHHLTRGNITMSMNKLNLFNLFRKTPLGYNGKTMFQQKWAAKSETRKYHGEHIREKQFKNVVFDKKLESYSQLDASLRGHRKAPTPITLQAFANLEKRLETALFRSMFVSSLRQARQFVIGGFVKVNGVVMKHPAFPLKSGDVFSVDPQKVLYAMGADKPGLQKSIKISKDQIRTWNDHVREVKKNPLAAWEKKQNKRKSLDSRASEDASQREKALTAFKDMKIKQSKISLESILADILQVGKAAGDVVSDEAFAKYGSSASKKCARIYNDLVKQKHPLIEDPSTENIAKVLDREKSDSKTDRWIKATLREIKSSEWEKSRLEAEAISKGEDSKFFDTSFAAKTRYAPKLNVEKILEDESKAVVDLPFQRHLYGRKDPSRPYFTPWKPRGFLGAFAILPSHIEVSFDTCHAVYLRDPIARPGHSEVISPFPEHVHERAYMYYVRKGKA
ncbi:37S ribosomal protein NAM9, mitochondrial [Candida viswanathii]|uniref:Small ribosomal subunit protein uS4m n=1 Tax=Candida viswanathii TaxID=5486 RepID=A0A367XZF1_9ASCO|nr:37S ribosomal protein NAM9, mitochondrial [Candida viswanathii]